MNGRKYGLMAWMSQSFYYLLCLVLFRTDTGADFNFHHDQGYRTASVRKETKVGNGQRSCLGLGLRLRVFMVLLKILKSKS